MLDRFSVNAFLKSVIAAFAVAIMVVMALGAWDSWSRLQATNRTASAVEVSLQMFTALANLRLDRTVTTREMLADEAHTTINAAGERNTQRRDAGDAGRGAGV